MKNTKIEICLFCENCPHMNNGMASTESNCQSCPSLKKHGTYKTKSGEKIQRYICLKSYTTFSKYTNDPTKTYLHNRNTPVETIRDKALTQNYPVWFIVKELAVSNSTVRTIKKRFKKVTKNTASNMARKNLKQFNK